MGDELLTIEEVMNILKVKSKNTVYKMIKEDNLPAIKIGRDYRISTTEFKEWLEKKSKEEVI